MNPASSSARTAPEPFCRFLAGSGSKSTVCVILEIPKSLLAGFRRFNDLEKSGGHLPRTTLAEAVNVGAPERDSQEWRHSANRPINGVASLKRRVEFVESALREELKATSFQIPKEVHDRLLDYAKEKGISPYLQVLQSLAYFVGLAGVWEARRAASTDSEPQVRRAKGSVFSRFEKALKDDIHSADVIDEEQPMRKTPKSLLLSR